MVLDGVKMSVETFDVRVGSRYRLANKVGSGSFGDIYTGVDVRSGVEVGVKLESVKNKHPQLLYESKVYRFLAGGCTLLSFSPSSHVRVVSLIIIVVIVVVMNCLFVVLS